MRNLQTLDRGGILDVLRHLPNNAWTASIEDKCVHLRRAGSEMIFSPLTAVYFELTGIELHRGSFWHPEITERFKLPWWEINDIRNAEIGYWGNRRRQQFRLAMLEAIVSLIPAGNQATYRTAVEFEHRLLASC